MSFLKTLLILTTYIINSVDVTEVAETLKIKGKTYKI